MNTVDFGRTARAIVADGKGILAADEAPGTLTKRLVIAGTTCPTQAPPDAVAAATLRCLRRHAPAAVPGIVLLSGGRDHLVATLHLSLINQQQDTKPWMLSSPTAAPCRTRHSRPGPDARGTCRLRSEPSTTARGAMLGRYSPDMENASAAV